MPPGHQRQPIDVGKYVILRALGGRFLNGGLAELRLAQRVEAE
jgi:hypothetical protein